MNNTLRHPLSARSSQGFSLVEMIGVLAIIAILAVVIVPKVFSAIASSRVTSAVGSTNSMKTAVTEFAGKYGTMPLTVAATRIDDLLVTAGILDSRYVVKIGTQPGAVPLAGGVWSNATGTNYMLDGVTSLPAAALVVSAVITGVPLNDARELSLKIDGDAMTQPIGSALADTTGKVAYAAPVAPAPRPSTSTWFTSSLKSRRLSPSCGRRTKQTRPYVHRDFPTAAQASRRPLA